MKTYEIKMNRSRWTSLLICILSILLVVMLCTPYFTYGKTTTSFIPEAGDANQLYGKTWVLNGGEVGTEGYQKIDIADGKEKSTLYTTNMLRVNQKAALDTLNAAVANYNEIAEAVELCEAYKAEAADVYAKFEAVYNEFAKGVTPYVAPAEGEPATEPTEDQTKLADMEKALTSAKKKADEAAKYFDTATAELANAEKAVNDAYAAASAAYAQDASFAWVTETTTAYNDALLEAYPEEAKIGFAEAKLDAFKTWLSEKYPEKFAEETGKKALNNFYDKLEKTAEDYDEFFAANETELTADEIITSAEKVKEVIAGKMSDAERDTKITGKLNDMKAASAKAADAAKAAQKATDAAIKAGAKKQTSDKAKKALDSVVKSFAPYKAEDEEEAAFEFEAAKVKRIAVKDLGEDFNATDKGIKEDTLMASPCTVKLDKKGVATFTFANGETKSNNFATSVGYDSEKTISLLGYVGFPYNADEFTAEAAYNIKDYYINDVVLLPIILGLLGVLGLVIGILKRDNFAAGICPTLAGIIGIIGYAVSPFIKMGDHFTSHMIFYAVILIVGALHIALGIRDWKNARMGK